MMTQSASLQGYLDDFLHSARFIASDQIDLIARYCRRQLALIAVRGARGRFAIPLEEIEANSRGAFLQRVFGMSCRSPAVIGQLTEAQASR